MSVVLHILTAVKQDSVHDPEVRTRTDEEKSQILAGNEKAVSMISHK